MGRFRWPWHKARPEGGSEARAQAEENLRMHKRQRQEVEAIAARLRNLRERNHFAEQLETIMRGQG